MKRSDSENRVISPTGIVDVKDGLGLTSRAGGGVIQVTTEIIAHRHELLLAFLPNEFILYINKPINDSPRERLKRKVNIYQAMK